MADAWEEAAKSYKSGGGSPAPSKDGGNEDWRVWQGNGGGSAPADPSSDSAVKRAGRGFLDTINPMNMISGYGQALGSIGSPMGMALPMINRGADIISKGGSIPRALVGGTPVVGDVSEDIHNGNYAGAAGRVAGLGTMAALPEAASRASEIPAVRAIVPAIKGAAQGGWQGGTEMTKHGMMGLHLPKSLAGAASGEFAGRMMRLPSPGPEILGGVGAAVPIIRGAVNGARNAVRESRIPAMPETIDPTSELAGPIHSPATQAPEFNAESGPAQPPIRPPILPRPSAVLAQPPAIPATGRMTPQQRLIGRATANPHPFEPPSASPPGAGAPRALLSRAPGNGKILGPLPTDELAEAPPEMPATSPTPEGMAAPFKVDKAAYDASQARATAAGEAKHIANRNALAEGIAQRTNEGVPTVGDVNKIQGGKLNPATLRKIQSKIKGEQ